MDTKVEPTHMPSPQLLNLHSQQGAHQPQAPKKFRIVLLGGSIALGAMALLVGLIVQIMVVHEYTIESSTAIVTTAPLGRTLAIVHACSSLVSNTVPLLLGLEAYRIGSAWLVASRHGSINRPTPAQLGVIMNVLAKANPSGFWLGFKALMRFGSKKKGPTIPQPPLLRTAVITLMALLALGWGCVGFEEWLGITSTAIFLPKTTAWDGPSVSMSRVLNETKCQNQFTDITNGVNLCGLITGGNNNNLAANPEGIRVLTNNSNANAIAYTQDNIAIVVPPASQIPDNVQFTATTHGLWTTCKTITSQCIDPSNPGPEAFLAYNCPPSTNVNNTAMNAGHDIGGNYPFGIVDSTGTPLADNPWLVASNPFNYLAVVISFAYFSANSNDQFVGDTGFFVHGHNGATNVLSCQMTAYDVTYSYFNGSYTSIKATLSESDTVRRVVALSNNIETRITFAVDGKGLNGGSYADAFAMEASKEILGLSSQIWQSGPTLAVSKVVSNIGSRFPLAPLLALLLTVAIYALIALLLMALALRAAYSSPDSALAKRHLTDPLTSIHAAYGPIEASRTWEPDPEDMFSFETEHDRLNVGPMCTIDGSVAFGVSRHPLV